MINKLCYKLERKIEKWLETRSGTALILWAGFWALWLFAFIDFIIF